MQAIEEEVRKVCQMLGLLGDLGSTTRAFPLCHAPCSVQLLPGLQPCSAADKLIARHCAHRERMGAPSVRVATSSPQCVPPQAMDGSTHSSLEATALHLDQCNDCLRSRQWHHVPQLSIMQAWHVKYQLVRVMLCTGCRQAAHRAAEAGDGGMPAHRGLPPAADA